jgi:hypothetical protein
MHENFLRYMMIGLSRGLVSTRLPTGARRWDGRDEDEQYFRELTKTAAHQASVPIIAPQPTALVGCHGRVRAGLRRCLALLQPGRRFHAC